MRTFKIIDWRADFIQALGQETASLEPQNTLILFPHNRPIRHLREWYITADLPKPRILPQFFSFNSFVSMLCREIMPIALSPASRLDQIALVMDIVQALPEHASELISQLPHDAGAFFPWGKRLASLLEEFLIQGIVPQDLKHLEEEITPWAAMLLANLGTIAKHYIEALQTRNWTTPGFNQFLLAKHIDDVFAYLQEKTIIAAGFYALSGTEDILFKKLWAENLLEVYWHTDPQLAHGQCHHPDVQEHRLWLKRWGAKTELIHTKPCSSSAADISFIEGFDLHSQLQGLCTALSTNTNQKTAVVLPDTAALPPLLHHLPEEQNTLFNISMGYPFERSSLFQLLDTIFTLQEQRNGQGNYFRRNLLNLLQHPYIKMLEPDPESPQGNLRRVLHVHTRCIRNGETHQNPYDWQAPYGFTPLEDICPETSPETSHEVESLRQNILTVCFDAFSNLSTLAQVATALENLVTLLHTHGAHLWNRFILDAEYLSRLSVSILPQLYSSALSSRELGFSVLFTVLRSLLRSERISFEPEPLTGLQIMGMLETRLLSFKRIYLVDAVEGKLPTSLPYDPLLPDSLRHTAGLPDSHERDAVSAYNFKRLIMSAKQVVLLYQTGAQPGQFDSKATRSRYVEELIWEQEKKERRGKQLMLAGEHPIHTVSFKSSPVPLEVEDIPITPHLGQALRSTLSKKGLSASALDCWLTCPKQFFYKYIARIYPLEEVKEQGDPAAFGRCIHQALKQFFMPYKGQELDISLLDAHELIRNFNSIFDADKSLSQAAWNVRLALKKTAELRLQNMLHASQTTHIVDLEKQLHTHITIQGVPVPLQGILDRIDLRKEEDIHGAVILDYKTGQIQSPAKDFWNNTELWEQISQDRSSDFLSELKQALPSIQLPLYLFLYARQSNTPLLNAGWIAMKQNGKEIMLFDSNCPMEKRHEIIHEQIPTLIQFLIQNMLEADTFTALKGQHCTWCDYRKPCK